MRRVTWMIALAVFVVGAGTAQAQVIRFSAHLSGTEEAPTKVLTGSFGTASVRLDLATQTVSWQIDIFNMPSGTTAAHFHVGGPGVAGPIVVNVPVPVNISNDYRLSGSATPADLTPRPEQGIRSWEDFVQSLIGGQMYLNVHSAANPAGEVRGQVVRIDP